MLARLYADRRGRSHEMQVKRYFVYVVCGLLLAASGPKLESCLVPADRNEVHLQPQLEIATCKNESSTRSKLSLTLRQVAVLWSALHAKNLRRELAQGNLLRETCQEDLLRELVPRTSLRTCSEKLAPTACSEELAQRTCLESFPPRTANAFGPPIF